MPRRVEIRLTLCICWLALWHPTPALAAAENETTPQDYQIRVWGTNDGLPVNSVTDVAQTPEGYLWSGTLLSGLLRFDGVRFVQYNPGNTPELPAAGIRRVMVDHAGSLWISTYDRALATWSQKGFALVSKNAGKADSLLYSRAGQVLFADEDGVLLEGTLVGKTWEWKSHKLSDAHWPLLQFCADKEGRVWCWRGERELGLWENGVLKKLAPPPGLEDQRISSLAADANGDIWAGTDRGLMKWESGRFVDGTPEGSGSPLPVTHIVPAGESLWVESPGRLRRFADGKRVAEAKDWEADYSKRAFRFRKGDDSGAFWVGNDELGLVRVGPDGASKIISTRDGLPSNAIRTIFPDRAGNIWIGYERGGLVQLRPRYFQLIGRGQGLSDTLVNSVCEDADGAIWIGTAGKVVSQFKDGRCTNHVLPVVEGAHETVVAVDASNRVWAGCWGAGLLRFTDGKFVPAISAESLQGDARLMLPSSDGRLWVGTLATISIVDGNNARQVYNKGRDSNWWPAALAQTTDGTIWAGTFGGKLLRWDGSQFVEQARSIRESLGRLWSLCPSPDGGLWIGTSEGGLLRWRDGTFLRLTRANGLHSDYVTEVQLDLQGNLWIVTGAGVEKIQAQALAQFERGETKTIPVSRFSRTDGSTEVGGSIEFQPNSWRGRDGRLWFAMGNNVGSIRPEEVRLNPTPPTVGIEELLVNQVRVWPENPGQVIAVAPPPAPMPAPSSLPQVTLPPGQHDLQFYFTGLECSAPQLVAFQYQLEGFEKDWHQAQGERSARYYSPPPGKYIFRVRAANNDDVWNENSAALNVEIRPFFYQTAWFRSASGICAVTIPALAVLFVLRRRMHRRLELLAHELEKEREVERDRARIAQDMHDEIGAKLTRISYLSELAKHTDADSEPATTQMDTIADLSRDLLQSLDEIVWVVDPCNDTLENMATYLGQYANEYFQNTDVDCSIHLPGQLPSLPVASEVRHNFYLAFDESLTNVLKHSAANRVHIEMKLLEDGFEITVADNGAGFARPEGHDESAREPGADGLKNMRNRMAAIGGRCEVDSEPGKGTTIRFFAPIFQKRP